MFGATNLFILRSTEASVDDTTTDLSGEDLAHGVLYSLTSVLVDVQIVDYF